MTTPTPDELCERLREADRNSVQRCLGSRIFAEAADLIQQQQTTIERLSAALEGIISETGDRGDGLIDWQRCVDRIQDRARAALGKDASDLRSPGSSEGE